MAGHFKNRLNHQVFGCIRLSDDRVLTCDGVEVHELLRQMGNAEVKVIQGHEDIGPEACVVIAPPGAQAGGGRTFDPRPSHIEELNRILNVQRKLLLFSNMPAAVLNHKPDRTHPVSMGVQQAENKPLEGARLIPMLRESIQGYADDIDVFKHWASQLLGSSAELSLRRAVSLLLLTQRQLHGVIQAMDTTTKPDLLKDWSGIPEAAGEEHRQEWVCPDGLD